jgi:type IV fimbrial biogenesis protein FimT
MAIRSLPFPVRRGAARRASGFTLAEALPALAILGLLAAIAASMLGGVHAARAAEARAALLDTYQAAIRHAATRGVHVVACPAGTGGGCRDTVDWSGGWLMFEDRDNDRSRDPDERVVSSWPALGAKVHLRSTAGRKRLVFQPNGGNTGSNATLTLCDGRGTKKATQLVLSNQGRLRETPAPSAAANACMAPTP